jgi:hypothetical protein
MRKLTAAALFLSLAGSQMGGCGSTGGGVFVSYVVVVNTTDSFTATLVGFDVDSTIDRTWVCTEPQANLTIASSFFSGSVHIVVEDDNGDVVYNNVHEGSVGAVTVQTKPGGVPGTWRVFMDFDDAAWSGAIVLEADDPPTQDEISIGTGVGGDCILLLHASWDASSADIHLSVAGGLSGGSVTIRLWDPDDDFMAPAPYEVTLNAGASTFTDDLTSTTTGTAPAGTWQIQIILNDAALGGAITLSN